MIIGLWCAVVMLCILVGFLVLFNYVLIKQNIAIKEELADETDWSQEIENEHKKDVRLLNLQRSIVKSVVLVKKTDVKIERTMLADIMRMIDKTLKNLGLGQMDKTEHQTFVKGLCMLRDVWREEYITIPKKILEETENDVKNN